MGVSIRMLAILQAINLLLPGVMVDPADIQTCMDLGNPRSKCVVHGMTTVIVDHIAWDDWDAWSQIMKNFFVDDLIYDSNWTPNMDFGNSSSLREWFDREHIPFNLAFDNTTFSLIIEVGEEMTSSYIAYGKAKWIGDIGTVPGSQFVGKEVTIWDLDFYKLDEEGTRIAYNWCLIDFVDLMRQLGYQVLPKPALPEGVFYPPKSMDGIPAPVSRLANPRDAEIAKDWIASLLNWDFVEGNGPSHIWHENMTWYGGAGFGKASNRVEYEEHILKPIRDGLSNRALDLNVLNCEGSYCGAHGYLSGDHSGVWFGEEQTGLRVNLRFGIHWRVNIEAEVVEECWAMFDLPAAFIGLDINLFDRMNEKYRIL